MSSDDYGERHNLRDAVEIYISYNPVTLYEYVDEMSSEPNDVNSPIIVTSYVEYKKRGLRKFDYYEEILEHYYQSETVNFRKIAWEEIEEQIRNIEDVLIKSSSNVPAEERQNANVKTFSQSDSVEFIDTATITIEYEEAENEDGKKLVVRLVYGGPWYPTYKQYLVNEVHSNGKPESINEVLALVRLCIEMDPIDELPIKMKE